MKGPVAATAGADKLGIGIRRALSSGRWNPLICRLALGTGRVETLSVKTLFFVATWCLLCIVCWPLAILAVILWPLAWLLAFPFRLVAAAVEAVFALIKALLFLPARLLGSR
jgi:hypothetical protein